MNGDLRVNNFTNKAMQMFVTEIQKKLLFTVTGKTAAELIISRANPKKTKTTMNTFLFLHNP
jgi:hypothetical protein